MVSSEVCETQQLKEVRFVVYVPETQQISLVVCFSNEHVVSRLMRSISGGFWEVTLSVAPGDYTYHFLLDNEHVHSLPGGVEIEGVWVQDIPAAPRVGSPLCGRYLLRVR